MRNNKLNTLAFCRKPQWIVGIGLVLLGILDTSLGHAQSPASRPQFEAVSIKPTPPEVRGSLGQVLPGGKSVGRNVTLKYLMTVAYSVTNYQILGVVRICSKRKLMM
jgi:hypothetical protein